jgi:SNF2 family DNA or RNA helicase
MPKLKKYLGPAIHAKHDAFPFQMEAFQALKGLEYGAIFHEQGLGKTKIGIDLGLHWLSNETVDSVIFVTKKSLVSNWEREIKFHTNLKPGIIGSNRSKNFYLFNRPVRFYIVHYEAIKSEKERFELFSKTRNLGIILDEAQKIKNPTSSLFQAFKEISEFFVRKMVMTGTPVANRPYDIWAPIYFLDQGKSLGIDFDSFKRDYDLPKPAAAFDDVDGVAAAKSDDTTSLYAKRLGLVFEKVSAFAIRETKNSVELKLPNKVYHKKICQWETTQQSLYQSYVEEAKASLLQAGEWLEDDADSILKKLLRLVQVASNPMIIDDSYQGVPGKFEELHNIVQQNRVRGEKTIVWSSFTKNVDWLTKELDEFGAVKIHGKMDMASRDRSVDNIMNSNDCFVLVATPGAAKEGLTLTSANHTVFYDRSFSLDDYLQAQDRIHRISQERECFITTLTLPGSIDEWVDDLLIAKELSAKLSLGDVDEGTYVEAIDFSFFANLRELLTGGERYHD